MSYQDTCTDVHLVTQHFSHMCWTSTYDPIVWTGNTPTYTCTVLNELHEEYSSSEIVEFKL